MDVDTATNATEIYAPGNVNGEPLRVGSAVPQVGQGDMVPSGSTVGKGTGLNVGSSVSSSVGVGVNRGPEPGFVGVKPAVGGSVGAFPS